MGNATTGKAYNVSSVQTLNQSHAQQKKRPPPPNRPPPRLPDANFYRLRGTTIERLNKWESKLKSIKRDPSNVDGPEKQVQNYLERMETELHAWNADRKYILSPSDQWTEPNEQVDDVHDKHRIPRKLPDKDETLKKLTETHRKELDDMKRSYEQLEKEKNEALTRLSELSSKNLRDKNPNIADLNDKNRPTKLAERYTELYDTDWTDCFQSLTKTGMADEKAVAVLHSTLLDVYCNCKLIIEKHTDGITEVLTSILSTHKVKEATTSTGKGTTGNSIQTKQQNIPNSATNYPPAVADQRSVKSKQEKQPKTNIRLKPDETLPVMPVLTERVEYRQSLETFLKDIAPCMVRGFQLNCIKVFEAQYAYSKHLDPFVSKCAELCLYMLVQPQPMVFIEKFKENDKFESAFYKAYTQAGPVIDFIVWPALLLYQDGPLLCKGVAQGKAETQTAQVKDKLDKPKNRNAADNPKEN